MDVDTARGQLSIRPYLGPQDDEQLFSFKPSFRLPWPWLTGESLGGPPIILVATDGAHVIGFIAMFPRRLEVRGSSAIVYGGAPFVRPAYRRSGVFARLASAMARTVHERGATIFGFPNEKSIGQWKKKMDGHVIGHLSHFIKPLDASAIVRRALPGRAAELRRFAVVDRSLRYVAERGRRRWAPPLRGHHGVQRMTTFDTRFDRLWEDTKSTYPVLAVRDRAYLEWLSRQPGSDNVVFVDVEGDRARGWIVVSTLTRRDEREGTICDLFTGADETIASGLLGAAEDHLRTEGCGIVRARVAWPRWERLLERSGYWRQRERSLFGVVANSASALRPVPPSADWYVTHADALFA